MIDSSCWELINEVIYQIYSAMNLTDIRFSFLRSIESLIPHEISFFDLKSTRRGKDIYFDPVSLNTSDDILKSYYSSFIDKDYTSWATSQSHDIAVYRDSDFISDAARENSVFYKDWLKPMDILYGCCINVAYEDIDYGSVTFGRNENDGDFSEEEMNILAIIARHLDQAFHHLYPAGIPYTIDSDRPTDLQNILHLTNREVEICEMLREGLSTADIARALCVSPNTVSRHLANIYKKTSVNNRIALLHKMNDLNQ